MQQTNDFVIRNIPKLKCVIIFFDNFAYGFKLRYQDWDNLVSFLRKTAYKKNLPKGAVQFSEFDIDTNNYIYNNPDLYEKWYRDLFMKHEKDKKSLDQHNKYLQKRKLQKEKEGQKDVIGKTIGLRTKNFVIWLDRVRFKRFRKFCLSDSQAGFEVQLKK